MIEEIVETSPALLNDLAFLSASERTVFDALFRSLGQWQSMDVVRTRFVNYGYSINSFKAVLCHVRKRLDGSEWLIDKQAPDTIRMRRLPS
jgi:hypothetical protein